MDKSVFVIDTPSDATSGAYALLVSRGMPFGGGGGTAVFYVDTMAVLSDPSGRATLFEGRLLDETVVTSFPVGTAFIVAPRHQVRALSQLEYQLEEKKEAEEVEAALKSPVDPNVTLAVQAVGQYL